MNRMIWWLVSSLLLSMFASCEHRPMVEREDVHYIRVYLDEQIRNITMGFYRDSIKIPEYKRPVVLRAVLADPLSGTVVSERFLQGQGEDERGYYVDGYLNGLPGDYHLLIYNYATETALIRNEDNFYQMEGYTYQIPDYLNPASMRSDKEGKGESRAVHYEPDILFLAVEEKVKLKETMHLDTLYAASGDYFVASPCTRSYYMQLPLKGMEYVASVVATLTGLGESVVLNNGKIGGNEAVGLYIPLHKDFVDGGKKPVAYGTFNTFGKLPLSTSLLQVDIVTTYGSSISVSMDITPMFDTDLVRINQWILIDQEIVIDPPPEGDGGFNIGVEEWEQEDSEILI